MYARTPVYPLALILRFANADKSVDLFLRLESSPEPKPRTQNPKSETQMGINSMNSKQTSYAGEGGAPGVAASRMIMGGGGRGEGQVESLQLDYPRSSQQPVHKDSGQVLGIGRRGQGSGAGDWVSDFG